MADHWVRGVGLGSDVMKQVFQTYPTIFDGSYPIHTHNNYLQMWGETGILGLISFLALLAWQVKSGIRAFVHAGDKRVRRMLAAAVGAFCGILVIGLAEYTWFYPRNMFTYWFLFGVIAALCQAGPAAQGGARVLRKRQSRTDDSVRLCFLRGRERRHWTAAKACSRSAMMSSMCSVPTDRRMVLG